METSVASSARARPERRSPLAAIRAAATLLTGLPRAPRRLFDRIGVGLRRFDDNLWDGSDET